MPSFDDVPQMLRHLKPQDPVYCIYPHVYAATTRRFLQGFPGRVLYAVKANNDPGVLRCLLGAGVQHFDCASLVEIAQLRSLDQRAKLYFMNPVRIRGAAHDAQQKYRVRHFVIDHESGLESLLEEVVPESSIVFVRMAVSHDSAKIDLSSKFGASPEATRQLLEQVQSRGAEPALAFNVGSVVMAPDAFVQALGTAREVLENLPFRVRLVDIGGGFPKSYPGFDAPALETYFDAIRACENLPLAADGELLAEPGRALSTRGMSAVVQVLLRKDDCLFLNDGMYGAFWELRFRAHERFAARVYRADGLFDGECSAFRLYGPTCDSTDMLPGKVELPTDIAPGDYIEFGSVGSYSLSGRTDFNGFFSDTVVEIDSAGALPPA